MSVLGDHRHCAYEQLTCPLMAQHSAVTGARVQPVWNEWEIQCLVLVSFSLQIFLLFSASFRKQYRFPTLSALLWLANLSAEHLAVFVLGGLTLYYGNPCHQLVLFWAPFLMLHLGGQETITAFSMEDCALWKRQVLNLTTQLALAIYIVGKQWRWDKQVVAPMVLIFISATIKYAERTYALWRVGSFFPIKGVFIESNVESNRYRHESSHLAKLALFFSSEVSMEHNFERVMELANEEFQDVMEFFMDVKVQHLFSDRDSAHEAKLASVVEGLTSSANGAELAYKLAEIYLSLMYDYLYTKFGSLKGKGVLYRLTILVLTSTALPLFFLARPTVEKVDHKLDSYSYSGVDVTISYILLVGAITLEISSIFMWLISSYWPYITAISYLRGRSRASRCAGRVLLSIVKHLRPRESRMGWSGKMQQYNMFDKCIQMKQPVSWLEQMMRRVGMKQQAYTAKHVVVSPEVKNVLLHKLREIATNPDSVVKLAFTSFHGEWVASLVAREKASSSSKFERSAQRLVGKRAAQCFHKKIAAQQVLQLSHIQSTDLVSSALLWHLVTEVCLVVDETPTVGSSKFRTCSQQLSNYIMYLLAQCKLMLDCDGHAAIQHVQDALGKTYNNNDDQRRFIQKVIDDNLNRWGLLNVLFSLYDLTDRVPKVSSELLKSEAAEYRWELIATVWIEMLCYIARNCGSGFHAKQLSAGGEFLTHVKLLVFLFLDDHDV